MYHHTLHYLKRTIVAMPFVALILCIATIQSSPANGAAITSIPVVYFSPHQDDETITMGASIYSHVKAGRTVYVVQVTDGSSSGALATVNKKLVGSGLQPITKEQFSNARDAEQLAALIKLGVNPANVFHESIYNAKNYDSDGLYLRDSRADYGAFLDVVDKYIKKIPNASYKTMSWLDYAPDHYKLGYALNDRCISNVISDCRFFQSPLYTVGSTLPQVVMPSGVKVPQIATPIGGIETAPSTVMQAVVNEYKLWKPSIGRYSIGYFSVSAQLNYAVSHPVSKYHRSSKNWPTIAMQKAADNWVKIYQMPDLTIEP